MDVEFIEKYQKLSEMKEGDTATSKNRASFFVCGYHYDTIKNENVKVILDLNFLHDQYSEKRDMSQLVKILQSGDKFVCKSY
ncbi:MAG: hypothetical protein COB04_19580 [Gammaproteobacteria bacterium]|nr:MAG: hypothetical protein COB04_19580 [Gammaproteobacteria bacterium]